MILRVGFSRCLQALVHWCDFHAARGESDVFLLKQLLPKLEIAVSLL